MQEITQFEARRADPSFFLTLPALLGGLLVLGATLINGGTQHGPALLLRAVAGLLVVVIWPHEAVILRWRDLIGPLFALLLVSLGWSLAPDRGVASQSWISVYLVCMLYMALLAADTDWTGRLLVLAGAIGVVHSMLAVGQRLFSGLPRGTGGFFSPNDLVAWLAPLLLLCWQATRRSLPQKDGYLYAGAAFWLALGVWATASRAGMLAVAAGAVLWGMPRWRQRPALVLVAGAVCSAAYWLLRQRWQDPDPYAYARWSIWKTSLQVASKYPMGVGLGNYAEFMRQQGVQIADWVHFPHTANNAHNEVLQAWVELGWPGALAVLIPVGLVLASLLSQYERAAHLGVLATFALPALTSATLHVPVVAFLATVWAARVIRADQRRGEEWIVPRGLQWTVLLAVAVGIPGALGSTAMLQASAARDRRDLPTAQKLAHFATGAMPWSLGAAMLQESLEYKAGKSPLDCVQVLIGLAEKHPNAPEPWMRAAELLTTQAGDVSERWQVISQLWQQAAERDPRNALVWNLLGEARSRAGDDAGALKAWERAITEEPNCARVLLHLARVTPSPHLRETYRDAARAASEQAPRYKGYAHSVLALDASTAP